MAATALGWGPRRSAARRPVLGADDQRLVARVRAGDDTAFEAIYDRYSRGLLAFCRQLLSSRDEAEDALQHSFGAAYRMLRASDNDVELRPWLYTIARNRCMSLLRSRRKEISLDGAPDFGGVADGLADQVQRRSDLRELVDDMRRLPDNQRSALVLFELGGLPHDEIATVLGVRREKVKALIFQAREGLMRARRARALPCTDMREQLATVAGKVPTRSMLRRHVDRCPSCALFEAEVGRQRAGLALILPVLPTAGLKAIVLGSSVGRGAAVAGGGAGAGGGAAVLGGAGGGGGGLACAGASGGAAGLAGAGAGAGAASTGGILAGAAAGGVSGTLATASGAGTIAAALGAKGASGVVVKLLAVVIVGGGAAGVGDVAVQEPFGGQPPAVQQEVASPVPPAPAIQALLAGPARPGTDAPLDAGTGAVQALGHDPLPLTASDSAVLPATTAQTVPAPAGAPPAAPPAAPVAPVAPTGVLPTAGVVTPGPAPATSPAPTTPAPVATSEAPPATAAPVPAVSTTPTAAATPVSGTPSSSETTPAAGGGTPTILDAPATPTSTDADEPATTSTPASAPGGAAPGGDTSPGPPAVATEPSPGP
jgi:RNA polymerase sigma factor (sigma-70 family)